MKRTALLASLLTTVMLCLALASAAPASDLTGKLVDVRSQYEDTSRPDTPSVFGVRHSPLDAFLRENLEPSVPVVFATVLTPASRSAPAMRRVTVLLPLVPFT